jgi:hypothetical protein
MYDKAKSNLYKRRKPRDERAQRTHVEKKKKNKKSSRERERERKIKNIILIHHERDTVHKWSFDLL